MTSDEVADGARHLQGLSIASEWLVAPLRAAVWQVVRLHVLHAHAQLAPCGDVASPAPAFVRPLRYPRLPTAAAAPPFSPLALYRTHTSLRRCSWCCEKTSFSCCWSVCARSNPALSNDLVRLFHFFLSDPLHMSVIDNIEHAVHSSLLILTASPLSSKETHFCFTATRVSGASRERSTYMSAGPRVVR